MPHTNQTPPFTTDHELRTLHRRVIEDYFSRRGESRLTRYQLFTEDGSGGLWIPVPFTAGGPGQIVHFTGGQLHEAPLPVSGQRLIVLAIAHVPGSTRSFGAGQIHRKNNPGTGLHAVLLQVN